MNKIDENYGHSVIAEIYDQVENYTDDIEMIKKLIKDMGKLNILECFSGTGRIMIPLIKEGHTVTGIDLSTSMINRAKLKINNLSDEEQKRVTLINDDILKATWGNNYDLIIIGCNAFYELPTPELQEKTIELAYNALKNGGLLFIDSDDYKGNFSDSRFFDGWISLEGKCENGEYGKLYTKHVNYNKDNHILNYKRSLEIVDKNGNESVYEYYGQKHPVTKTELEHWLNNYNFNIVKTYGDWNGNPYSTESRRAIFLATK